MTQQQQEPPLSQHVNSNKGGLGMKDILKWWIQPPTFLLSIVIIAELYIVIAYHVTNITLLILLLIIVAIFAGIGIKDIITAATTMKGISSSKDISPS